MPDQRVIEKYIEVLKTTNDGNDLTEGQLSEIQFLSNNYHRLTAAMTKKALKRLDEMMVKEADQ
ncbi:MAG: hypothetical protein HY548_09360 [Elusimicrobia bacterium]|nr:hypothetical protein [Elusimicrobiota bacterium]